MSFHEKIPESRLSELIQQENPEIRSEMAHRILTAREFGRICLDEIPDFIGNFFVSEKMGIHTSNPLGIFEMTITKNNKGSFTGSIKDCYGNATVEGNLTESEINFIKKYIPKESSVTASKKPLIYEGILDVSCNHNFRGSWRVEGEKDFRGNFYL